MPTPHHTFCSPVGRSTRRFSLCLKRQLQTLWPLGTRSYTKAKLPTTDVRTSHRATKTSWSVLKVSLWTDSRSLVNAVSALGRKNMRLKSTVDTNIFIKRRVPTPSSARAGKYHRKSRVSWGVTMMSIADLASKNTDYPVKFEFHVNNQSFLG